MTETLLEIEFATYRFLPSGVILNPWGIFPTGILFFTVPEAISRTYTFPFLSVPLIEPVSAISATVT